MRPFPSAALVAFAWILGGAATSAWAQAEDRDDVDLLDRDGLASREGAAAAEAPDLRTMLGLVECRSGPWVCLLRGALRKDGLGLSGVHLGRAELGLPRANTATTFEIALRLPGGGRLVGDLFDFGLRGQTVPGKSISFGGTPLQVGQPLATGLRLTGGVVVARYPIVGGPDHRLDWDAGLQLVRARVAMTQPELRLTTTALSPFVVLGVHSYHRLGAWGPGPVVAETTLQTGHWAPLGIGSHQRNWSLRLRVALRIPLARLAAEPDAPATASLVLEYTYEFLDQERFRHVDKRDIDLELHGPQLALAAAF